MDVARTNEPSPAAVGFIGDLQDPWVIGLAGILARSRVVHPLDCSRILPERPFDDRPGLAAIVVHRHSLTARDVEAVKLWRSRRTESLLLNREGEAPAGPHMAEGTARREARPPDRPPAGTYSETNPRLILCVSPFVRYAELERWSELFDMVVSEAVAPTVLPGRLARVLDQAPWRRADTPRSKVRIEVAGGDDELSRALVDACKAAGYTVAAIDEAEIGGLPAARPRQPRLPAGARVLTIWEVPVLEDGWASRLEWRVRRTGPVVALAGFLDRAVADRARSAGAVAALELPCDLDDLIDAVDRAVVETRADDWPIPPRAEPAHVLPPRRKPRASPRLAIAPSTWPDRGPLPRIPSRGE